MDEIKPNEPNSAPEEKDHFMEALESLQATHGRRVSKTEEERIKALSEAVRIGDKVKAEEHLLATKVESSWLYEELMQHPMISQMLREISIFGL